MPEWVHNRAYHILSKNPDMDKGQAFAIATQQAHATGHTPKDFGTAAGKREAKAKYDEPKRTYEQTSDPKRSGQQLEHAEDLGDARIKQASLSADGFFSSTLIQAFSDELQKIANISGLPAGLTQTKSTIPTQPLSGKTPRYSKVNSEPTQSPLVGQQPLAGPPSP